VGCAGPLVGRAGEPSGRRAGAVLSVVRGILDGVGRESIYAQSIYEAAGGAPAFARLAAAHHERCLADPVLEHPFSHGTKPDHVARLAAYWAEVFGGPADYSRDYGDHSGVLEIHCGNGEEMIELGGRFVACFVAAADDAGLPDDPELRRVLRDYMCWAVNDVASYGPHDAIVPAGLGVPRWSWDGPA
jgi:hemoglobin